jgi:hypothetical protein
MLPDKPCSLNTVMATPFDPLPHLVTLPFPLIHPTVLTTVYRMQLLCIQMITPIVKPPHISEALCLVLIIRCNLLITLSMRQDHRQHISNLQVAVPATASPPPRRGSCLCLKRQGLYHLLLIPRIRRYLPPPCPIPLLQLDTIRPSSILRPRISQFPHRRRYQ